MSRQEIKNMAWKIARWLGEDRIVYDKNEYHILRKGTLEGIKNGC